MSARKSKQKLPDTPITASFEKFVPGGQALATLENGKKAFVWGVLPGETAEFQLTKNKSSYCEGVATKILKPSPNRIVPKDSCYLSTSPWQILDYSYELEQKSALVKESFRQNGLGIKVNETVTDGKDYHYRNKMEYSLYFNHADQKIHLAFHRRGSHGKIPISESNIERPEIFQKASKIVNRLNVERQEARNYQSLLIRCDQQGNTSGDLFVKHQAHPTLSPLSDELLGYEYRYSPNGFFQINLPVYELALREIQKHIKTEKVLDLYAGVGSIGLSVARDKNLTLVEVNDAAFAEMQNNAKDTNATCILAKSEDATDYIAPDQSVILDPPRAGCDQKLLEKLLEIQPESIIYLSCNPVTQARDLQILSAKYHFDRATPFNFFPRTPHIENLVILTRK